MVDIFLRKKDPENLSPLICRIPGTELQFKIWSLLVAVGCWLLVVVGCWLLLVLSYQPLERMERGGGVGVVTWSLAFGMPNNNNSSRYIVDHTVDNTVDNTVDHELQRGRRSMCVLTETIGCR